MNWEFLTLAIRQALNNQNLCAWNAHECMCLTKTCKRELSHQCIHLKRTHTRVYVFEESSHMSVYIWRELAYECMCLMRTRTQVHVFEENLHMSVYIWRQLSHKCMCLTRTRTRVYVSDENSDTSVYIWRELAQECMCLRRTPTQEMGKWKDTYFHRKEESAEAVLSTSSNLLKASFTSSEYITLHGNHLCIKSLFPNNLWMNVN